MLQSSMQWLWPEPGPNRSTATCGLKSSWGFDPVCLSKRSFVSWGPVGGTTAWDPRRGTLKMLSNFCSVHFHVTKLFLSQVPQACIAWSICPCDDVGRCCNVLVKTTTTTYCRHMLLLPFLPISLIFCRNGQGLTRGAFLEALRILHQSEMPRTLPSRL